MTLVVAARDIIPRNGEVLQLLRREVEIGELRGDGAPVGGRQGHKDLAKADEDEHNVYITVDREKEL